MTATDTAVADTTVATETAAGNGHLPDPGTSNQIEIWKPPTDQLKGYFDVTILDDHGVPPSNIIKDSTPWALRFDLWLEGDIWKCVSGTLCYDVYFERANDGFRTSLSEVLKTEIRRVSRAASTSRTTACTSTRPSRSLRAPSHRARRSRASTTGGQC
jgi:hypothetical protein